MTAITNQGQNLLSQLMAQSKPLVIKEFVFAKINGLDTSSAVNFNEPMPSSSKIVHRHPIDKTGYINESKVSYSVMLDTDIGDFDFNWIGLVTTENVLFAVAYVPIQYKRRTYDQQVGNNIARNFVLHFAAAQQITGITTPAESWQFDFAPEVKALELNAAIAADNQFKIMREQFLLNERLLALESNQN